jgi:hypothetical protein
VNRSSINEASVTALEVRHAQTSFLVHHTLQPSNFEWCVVSVLEGGQADPRDGGGGAAMGVWFANVSAPRSAAAAAARGTPRGYSFGCVSKRARVVLMRRL